MPALFKVTGAPSTQDALAVSWGTSGAIDGLELEMRVAGGPWSRQRLSHAQMLDMTATVPLRPDIPLGATIGVRMRAVRGSGFSAWTGEATIVRPKVFVSYGLIGGGGFDPVVTGGTVTIALAGWVSSLVPVAPDLLLFAGGKLVAPIGRPPFPRIPWNTVDFPEGDHVLEVRGADGGADPGFVVRGPVVRVDRRIVVEWAPGTPNTPQWLRDTPVLLSFQIHPLAFDLATPTVGRLWAGDILLAEFSGPPPWPTVTWDTATTPEGHYRVRVEIPNHSPEHPSVGNDFSSWEPFDVFVDRTGPRVTCEPPVLGAASGWKRGKGFFVANEFVTTPTVDLLVNGQAYPTDLYAVYWQDLFSFVLHMPDLPPFRVGVATDRFVDPAGNLGTATCEFDVPTWLAPLGTGPLSAGGTPIVASSFELDMFVWTGFDMHASDLPVPTLLAAWTDAVGGRLLTAMTDGFVLPAGRPLSTTGKSVTSASVSLPDPTSPNSAETRWVAWTEEGSGAPGALVLATWNGADWVRSSAPGLSNPSRAARDVRLRMARSSDGATAEVVFMEETTPGSWSLAGRRYVDGSWVEVKGDLGVPPGAAVSAPSLGASEGTMAAFGYPTMLAGFLVTPTGGVPQVHVSRGFYDKGWAPFLAGGNRDPAAPASDPTVVAQWEMAVAWVENGQVLARVTDLWNYRWDSQFSPETVLNHDPTRRARSPRGTTGVGSNLRPHVIFFVEEGPLGDEIWARRWNGTEWELIAEPVNAGVPGAVRQLSVRGLVVTWIDESGHVYVRMMNG